MNNKLHLIYFSPTKTTRKTVRAIASSFTGFEVIEHNMTKPDFSEELHITDGVAVIGLPVYAGRAQVTAIARMKGITAENVPAVLAVLYGNREFEDALVELRDITKEKGFIPVAGGAFIGEHSYADEDHPVALHRPDEEDLRKAADFGSAAYKKISDNDLTTPHMDGNVPYKPLTLPKGATPATYEDKCVACCTCEIACPTEAITIGDFAVSDADKCIMCMECAKVCSPKARYINSPQTLERIDMLVKNCSVRKEPKLFI